MSFDRRLHTLHRLKNLRSSLSFAVEYEVPEEVVVGVLGFEDGGESSVGPSLLLRKLNLVRSLTLQCSELSARPCKP